LTRRLTREVLGVFDILSVGELCEPINELICLFLSVVVQRMDHCNKHKQMEA